MAPPVVGSITSSMGFLREARLCSSLRVNSSLLPNALGEITPVISGNYLAPQGGGQGQQKDLIPTLSQLYELILISIDQIGVMVDRNSRPLEN